ncbi:hypothetical protein R1flu_007108 [Riccia fluitans]|uniref:DNA/RNA-binding protein Alba-like domain-containing protein n=1 Tax=Riccia fluitans TaxID=41844 RepID=A0ABD1YXY5_9MARC
MDRYQRVTKPRVERETPISDNEIRVTTKGKMRNYITYATALFKDKAASEVVLKGMARVVNKAVCIAEILKRRVVGLHQITSIGSTYITDQWQPLEEGLLPVETSRRISMITIILSKEELDKSSPGYQPPLPADQVKPWIEFEYEGAEGSVRDGGPQDVSGRGPGRRRGRGRGGKCTLEDQVKSATEADLVGGEVGEGSSRDGRRSGKESIRGGTGIPPNGLIQDISGQAESSHENGGGRGGNGTPKVRFSGVDAGRGRGRGQGRGRGFRSRGKEFSGNGVGPPQRSFRRL